MRIHEGVYAYDIAQPRDPLTQLALKWKFTVYRLRPVERVGHHRALNWRTR